MNEMRLFYLVERAVNQELTSLEQHELDLWLSESEENRAEYKDLKEILGFASKQVNALAANTDGEWTKLQAVIEREPVAAKADILVRPLFWSKSRAWSAAAAVAMLAVVGSYFLFFNGKSVLEKPLHFATELGEHKEIKLADGSIVTLQGGSSLDAPIGFGDKDRQLSLQGEAYFDVSKDKSRPFVVTAGSTKAEALGTQFNVRMSHKDAAVQLSVTEGKVRFTAVKGNELVLIAGEVAHFEPLTGKIVRDQAIAKDVAAWKNNQLIFKDTPFLEAAERIESQFGVTMLFPESLNAARLTANFDRKPLPHVLETLGRIYALKSSQSGAVVTLSE